MAFSYGLTNPAAFKGQFEIYPDLFKFYSAYPESTTQTSAANKRRPHLYVTLNGGINWVDETSGSKNFYNANYGGNLYFNATKYHLEAWAHKSLNSSYKSYAAACGQTATQTDLLLSRQVWTFNSGIPYSTSNQYWLYLNRNQGSTNKPGRYFGTKVGGGYVYNDDPWSTAEWTSFGTQPVYDNTTVGSGFRLLKLDPEDHYGMLIFHTDSTNYYLRSYLYDTDTATHACDYTTTVWGDTTHKATTYKCLSVEYLPKIGYIFIYSYSSENGFRVKVLYTYNQSTGEKLPYDQYYLSELTSITEANGTIVSQGSCAQWCGTDKTFYFAPNASKVYWTKDGLNWNSSNTTRKTSSTKCVKLFVDGQNMVIAVDALNFVYSRDKGQTWTDKSFGSSTSSTQGVFYADNRTNDGIVLPFKCINNVGINSNNVTIGYWLNNTDGSPTASAPNFYTNDYISIDPDTRYVFYGRRDDGIQTYSNRITFYDSSKNWISTVEGNSGTWYDGWPALTVSPSNAAYARISCRLYSTGGVFPTQEQINATKFYFAKESDFKVMTEYGDIVCN